MRRRFFLSAISVAAVAVMLLALPLAVLARNLIRADELAELEHRATTAERTVDADTLAHHDVTAPEFHSGAQIRLGLYNLRGTRIAGSGPAQLEEGLRAVRSAHVARLQGSHLVVAVPVIQDRRVQGAIRAAAPTSEVRDRVVRAWLLIAACGLGAIGLSGLLARWRSARLVQPIVDLEAAARRIGDGDFTSSTPRCGVAELDALAGALDVTAGRLGRALQRERAFSADASHQLLTPITALQVTLEAALLSGRIDAAMVEHALSETERLATTVDDLLTLARDTHDDREPLDVVRLVEECRDEWGPRLDASRRRLEIKIDASLPPVRASESAMRHVLNVLVSNAVEHGAGTVTVTARATSDGLAIDVSDEGVGFAARADDVFERRSGDDARRGIGLALARALTEAEGGRLSATNSAASPTLTVHLRHDETARTATSLR